MQTEPNAKQQIVERIKNSTNILVTVGRNPSVDALSAALSLTLMLNRLDKHATAVFSGAVPPAINFLEPGKTFENSVDSLRDFIIALDKEKADRLRYKVEDDVVRIFITPYKTVISQDDLKFSQGDFNVELVIALGVEKREDLDEAITAHGRILHDATVVTINADGGVSNLGATGWADPNASSLCEMLMSLSEALQSGLLDQQIATAVLTGIVAATDRFRNEHTSPRVMTMAAQLMAAGANQQLIAAKLEEGHALEQPAANDSAADGSMKLAQDKSKKIAKDQKPADKPDGSLEITHTPPATPQPAPERGSDALKEAEDELAKSLQTAVPAATPTLSVDDLQKDLAQASQDVDDAAASTPATAPTASTTSSPDEPKITQPHRDWRSDGTSPDEPAFGGTLNATTSEAEDAKRREASQHTNHQILSHDSPAAPAVPPPLPPVEPPAVSPPAPAPAPPPALESTADESLSFEPTPVPAVPDMGSQTLADIDSQTRGKETDEARAAVDAVLNSMPFDPAGQPMESSGAVPALEILHEDTPPTQPAPTPPTEPALPPLPDFSTLPPLPGEPPAQSQPPIVPSSVPPLNANDPEQPLAPQPPQLDIPSTDPKAFRIPGQ